MSIATLPMYDWPHDALVVHGFIPRLDDHYQVIADRWNAAETAGVGPLL